MKMNKLENLLKNYGVNSIAELRELIDKKDERVADLIEFIEYLKNQEKWTTDNKDKI